MSWLVNLLKTQSPRKHRSVETAMYDRQDLSQLVLFYASPCADDQRRDQCVCTLELSINTHNYSVIITHK